jgi:hypothetical protein
VEVEGREGGVLGGEDKGELDRRRGNFGHMMKAVTVATWICTVAKYFVEGDSAFNCAGGSCADSINL